MSIDKDKISRGPVEWFYPKGWDDDWYQGPLPELRCVGPCPVIMEFGNSEQYYPIQGIEPSEADRLLIAEAFNVFTETGMTPRELWEVVKLAKDVMAEIETAETETIGCAVISFDLNEKMQSALSPTPAEG